MSQRIQTLHPEGKEGVNIEQSKYDVMKDAILNIIQQRGEMPFGELADEVGKQLPNFDGSIGWYTTTVKLDLEARGLIQRVPKSSPQRLVLSS